MSKSQLTAAVLFTAFVALGCGERGGAPSPASTRSDGGPAKAPAAAGVSIDTIAAQAQGFSVGPAMSARVVYVFFDPQCPHCAALWQAAKPLRNQARFVWIPVGLMNQKSVEQGAAILAATDPVATMDAHEQALQGGKGGLPSSAPAETQKTAIAGNTKLMDSFGFASVPVLVTKHATTGAVVTREGSMPAAALAEFLGVRLPGS